MILKTVEVEVEVDSSDVLDDLTTEELIDELWSRGESTGDMDWKRLYDLLATKQDDEAMRLVREMVELKTGRIIP